MEETYMDRNNNGEGVKIGSGTKSFEQVKDQCLAAVATGKTVNSIPSKDNQHPYNPTLDKA
jgi:hypothetical protein